MKNKNILHKVVLGGFYLTILASMMACDPLGVEPTTMVDQDRFWENPQLTREYVNNFYTWTPVASGHDFQSEQWSDNCQGNNQTDWSTYRQSSFNQRLYDIDTPIDGLNTSDIWNNSYKHIRAINIGIERISKSTILTDAVKAQCLAECYFFRAWEYFDMEKYWGTVPYLDKSLTINDETFLPRIKREQLFDNILSDLTKATQYFTEYSGKPSRGMVNADVVEAFRSRVALYAACAAEASAKGLFSFDDKAGLFTFEKQAKTYYEIAYNAAHSLIGKYSLEPNYDDLFSSETAHKSVESIWPVMFDKTNRTGFNPTAKNGPDGEYYGNTAALSISWELRSGLYPTQDLVDCYLQQDEVDGKWKNWWETSQAKAMGIKEESEQLKGESADYRKIFEKRDKRFYTTVTYDGAYMGPKEERYIIQTWIDNSKPTGDKTSFNYSALHNAYRTTTDNMQSAPSGRSSEQTITSYYSRKYSHFDKWNVNGSLNTEQRSTCYFNIRYAEVLLNCAEASIKLNKGDAKTYINEIRQTHGGLDAYSGSDAGLMDELKLQKRLEFAFECPGFRYFDLLRWGESEGLQTIPELNRPSRGLWIFRKGIESTLAGQKGYPVAPGEAGYFIPHFQTAVMDYSRYQRKFNNARFYFIPFSQTTMSSYTGLVQNPGWTSYKYTD